MFGSNKLKSLNSIAKIGYGHLCLREENLRLSFYNNYIKMATSTFNWLLFIVNMILPTEANNATKGTSTFNWLLFIVNMMLPTKANNATKGTSTFNWLLFIVNLPSLVILLSDKSSHRTSVHPSIPCITLIML
jgi:hypothetical protein